MPEQTQLLALQRKFNGEERHCPHSEGMCDFKIKTSFFILSYCYYSNELHFLLSRDSFT